MLYFIVNFVIIFYMLIYLLFLFYIVFGYSFEIHSKIFNHVFKNNHKEALNDVVKLVNQDKIYGCLSTFNYRNKFKDYPHNSLVGCTIDDDGYPILCMSDISQHTKNIKKNNKVSLLVPKYGLKTQNENRVTITGNINITLLKEENELLKKKYLEKHPEAFWLKYIDFNMYKFDEIKEIYYIGGFGKATKININRYLESFKDN